MKLTPGLELTLMIFILIQGIPPIATKFVAQFMTRIDVRTPKYHTQLYFGARHDFPLWYLRTPIKSWWAIDLRRFAKPPGILPHDIFHGRHHDIWTPHDFVMGTFPTVGLRQLLYLSYFGPLGRWLGPVGSLWTWFKYAWALSLTYGGHSGLIVRGFESKHVPV